MSKEAPFSAPPTLPNPTGKGNVKQIRPSREKQSKPPLLRSGGRLLDISSGRELRRFGIPSLDEARAAGLFHPNCVHNVLYVPIDEYPPAILKALGGRLSSGEPAFGNPVKTNAGFETAASAKKRAAKAAKTAKEKAKREAEAEVPDTWVTLGLSAMEMQAPKAAAPLVSTEEALALLHDGITLTDVFGSEIRLGELARQHIVDDKKRKQQEIKQRLENINNVIETIRNPLEVWKDKRKPYTTYISLIKNDEAKLQIVHAVILNGTRVYSWHLNARELNHGRMGILLYPKRKQKRQGGEPLGA